MSRTTIAYIVGALVTVVVIASAAAPPLSGRYAEPQLRAFVDRIASAHGETVEWEVTSFEQGAYASSARSVLTIRTAEDETHTLRLQHELMHGPSVHRPYLGRVVTTLDGDGGAAAPLHEAFGEREPVTAELTVSLLGDYALSLDSPALAQPHPLPDGATAHWDGLSLDADWNRERTELAIRGAMPRMRVEGEEGLVLVQGLRLQGQASRPAGSSSGPWPGKSTIEIETLRTAASPEASDGRMTLDGITMRTQTGNDEKQGVSQRTHLEVARAEFAETVVESIDADVRLQGLHRSLFEAGERHAPGSEAWLEAIAFDKAVAMEPRLTVDPLKVETRKGTLEARLNAEIARDPDADGAVGADQWPQLLTAEARVAMPPAVAELISGAVMQYQVARFSPGSDPGEAVVEQLARKQLESLVSKGILEREDGAYTAQARFERGRITVNGRSMF